MAAKAGRRIDETELESVEARAEPREAGIGPAAGAERAVVAEQGMQRDAPVERWQRVAVAAYFCAERRGFAPGGELEDWLRAEAEIDGPLARSGAGAEASVAPTQTPAAPPGRALGAP